MTDFERFLALFNELVPPIVEDEIESIADFVDTEIDFFEEIADE